METLRIYLETSVWYFLFAEDAPDKREKTLKLFDDIKRGKHDIYISDVVIDEISAAPEQRRKSLRDALIQYRPAILEGNEESDALVEEYFRQSILKRRHVNDVLHLAIASAYGMGVIVSWNMRHIVKRNTQIVVNAVNHKCGYRPLEIWTPEELIDNEA